MSVQTDDVFATLKRKLEKRILFAVEQFVMDEKLDNFDISGLISQSNFDADDLCTSILTFGCNVWAECADLGENRYSAVVVPFRRTA